MRENEHSMHITPPHSSWGNRFVILDDRGRVSVFKITHVILRACVMIVVVGATCDAMNNHIVVTILHNEEIVDWTWISNPFREDFGEEYPVYEDDPFFVVEVYTEKYGVVSYGELPSGSRTEDIEYHIASDLMELAELLPKQMFGEILCDISEGDF